MDEREMYLFGSETSSTAKKCGGKMDWRGESQNTIFYTSYLN